MTTLQHVDLGVLGPLHVRQFGLPVVIPGAKPRAVLTMLGLHSGSVVPADTLVELLWGDDPPRTAAKALQTHISALRRALGDGFVSTQGSGWTLNTGEIDAVEYMSAAGRGRTAMAAGDAAEAVVRFDDALRLWRGAPELPGGRRGETERTRWVEMHAALVEDRADAMLATGRAAELIGELEAAIADAPLRERRWGQLMLALYRAGRQGEALAAYQRVRLLLADELGVDPGPDLRRLESKIVVQDVALELPVVQSFSSVMRAVTFLLTDIEGSTAAWEADAEAMRGALARHDEIVEQAVTFRGGRLIKTRGEGDATFSVFDRPSAAAAAAIELQQAITAERWSLAAPLRIRIALHTGEVEFRDGDYFGRAVNRAARLRSLAAGGQTLCSGATAELVIDSLAEDIELADLGMRQLKSLARPEHVFELRMQLADVSRTPLAEAPMDRPGLPAVLTGPGPFVGRGGELDRLLDAWQATLAAGTRAVLIAGEPGVGKTRLAGEWSRRAYDQGAIVVYGRCDEDLGAPYQPFAEALRTLVPCLGTTRLRGVRGVESLLALVPALADSLPDVTTAPHAAPDAERYALFDAVVALLGVASACAPVVVVLDDLHWAAKPTLLLLRHLLRFGDQARVQIVGTYRSTDLDRAHPLAAMLADLHRDGSATRLALGGLDESDVTTYVAEAGYDDQDLALALASVTGGNPFFLIEALRHVDESGGRWDPNSLPQGVREAVSRRLSRLPDETNKALAAAAVVGSRFAVELVERVVDRDLVDAFDEAGKAGLLIEESGGRYRFNHALVRQSLLAELPSVRRMRLHQKIAVALESEPGADDELLAELAYHYFECAWAGNADKAVKYCRRAGDQAMARLGYEGAADLYDKALHALEEIDDDLPDRDDQQAELLVARCEALLAAGDVVTATGVVAQLGTAAGDSARIAAWGTCFDGQLSMLTEPERLDDIEATLAVAAATLAGLDDAAGEAKAHTVRAGCLARLGRVGDCEIALDQALTAARRAREHRRVNAVLAGAPLAALWGPNPVPRAGGRCLDVVRLLRITTGSPVVEATSTRCQAVLDALRGRTAAGRQLIESARRTLNELGMRHAVLEVDQFAGIVELIADDAVAAERHLRTAYNGFRRMGLDADTAETAALLARACLALDRESEADELCQESERLAGHAFKAAISWRSVRAQLLARDGHHDEARRVAEEAVGIAERTDALVDHGDACLALAVVLDTADDDAGARAAAERAAGLYELKGAVVLAEKAHRLVAPAENARGAPAAESTSGEAEASGEMAARLENAASLQYQRFIEHYTTGNWEALSRTMSDSFVADDRRSFVGTGGQLGPDAAIEHARLTAELGVRNATWTVQAIRGERLALILAQFWGRGEQPVAFGVEVLHLVEIDTEHRITYFAAFDVAAYEVAVAELDARDRSAATRLGNTASRTYESWLATYATHDWEAMAELMAEGIAHHDRRRVANGGIQVGRAAVVTNMSAIAEVGVTNLELTVVATRGDRLALGRQRVSGGEQPDAFGIDVLTVIEVDAEQRFSYGVAFDSDDLDAAVGELDARFLAGEARPFSRAWLLVMHAYATTNLHQLPMPTPDVVDHRKLSAVEGDDLVGSLRTAWELTPDGYVYIEEVHRLTGRGAVVTHAAHGTGHGGFDAGWRSINVVAVGPETVETCELFDEADLGAALARFDEISRPSAAHLENTATRMYNRYFVFLNARDWEAMASMVAVDVVIEDRRHTVSAGTQRGRANHTASIRAALDVGVGYADASAVAIRGDRLALVRAWVSGDPRPESFSLEFLIVCQYDSDDELAAAIIFDVDDLDSAVAELDNRYLADLPEAHARAYSAIARGFDAISRGEIPSVSAGFVDIDHRAVTGFEPGGLTAYLRAGFGDMARSRMYIEAVHRLDGSGAVFTHVATGTSLDGMVAEWRVIDVVTLDDDAFARCELFDESDLDAALARFEDLRQVEPVLVNAASRVCKKFVAAFADRDWDALAEMIADDLHNQDRRSVVNAGVREGRDPAMQDLREAADFGIPRFTTTEIAIRGERLVLVRSEVPYDDQPGAFRMDSLQLGEIDADERISAMVVFDIDDLDAAIAELEKRYLAGEAAPYAQTWQSVVGAYAAFNRGEFAPTTPDSTSVDHRRGAGFAPGEITAYIEAAWDDSPGTRIFAESVHRLTDRGAVVTHSATGVSRDGFDAAWRDIAVFMVDGGPISRTELFDEADLESALARFDTLCTTTHLQNEATAVGHRMRTAFEARQWDVVEQLLAEDLHNEDRRHVVNGGIRRGRKTMLGDMRAAADLGVGAFEAMDLATRGERLALFRGKTRYDKQPGAFVVENLVVAELDADGRIAAEILFGTDDTDAAMAELDARYLAGEAASHARTWSAIVNANAAFNRREMPLTTSDWINVDHRRGGMAFAPGDQTAYIKATWDVAPQVSNRIVAVHRLSDLGVVFTQLVQATSGNGFNGEWRDVVVMTFDGEAISRCEVYDEHDLELALARFDELGATSSGSSVPASP